MKKHLQLNSKRGTTRSNIHLQIQQLQKPKTAQKKAPAINGRRYIME